MTNRRTRAFRLLRILLLMAAALFWMGVPRPPGMPGCHGPRLPRPPMPLQQESSSPQLLEANAAG